MLRSRLITKRVIGQPQVAGQSTDTGHNLVNLKRADACPLDSSSGLFLIERERRILIYLRLCNWVHIGSRKPYLADMPNEIASDPHARSPRRYEPAIDPLRLLRNARTESRCQNLPAV